MTTLAPNSNAVPLKLTVSVPDAAAALGIAPRTIRAWIACGKLRAVHLGRRVVIRVSELQRFLDDAESGIAS